MMQAKNSSPSRIEISREIRRIHDGWSAEERFRRRRVAICRQRELIVRLLQQATPSASVR